MVGTYAIGRDRLNYGGASMVKVRPAGMAFFKPIFEAAGVELREQMEAPTFARAPGLPASM